MTEVQGAETGDHVEEAVAIRVDDHRPLSVVEHDRVVRHPVTQPGSYFRRPKPFEDLA